MATRRVDLPDELYATRPAEFTKAREAVVEQLRAAGKMAQARQAQRQRRPTVALWVVNQLARQDPKALRAFIDTVQRTLRAQRAGGSDLQASLAQQHESMRRLSQHAQALLGEVGRTMSPDLVRRISATVLGAAVDPQGRTRLLHGTLDAEHPAPDLTVLGGKTTRVATQRVSSRQARTRANATIARQARKQARRLTLEATRRRRVAERSAREVETLRARLQRSETVLARRETEARRATEEAERVRNKGQPAA